MLDRKVFHWSQFICLLKWAVIIKCMHTLEY